MTRNGVTYELTRVPIDDLVDWLEHHRLRVVDRWAEWPPTLRCEEIP